ncbi:MAG: Crp/Fnr family transcriptional regulator [Anaeromicrobium sp.]|jgi:CRP-like cAMP-binding protein|uniref:Crp/Fnr family transcriptional regulator n=1 Tax=Anaeromicrobium sp. TaxID=1929132 RepID=UPI0025CFEFEA|nr:Crp/Fnr family transcriptional regulator [Anaeromicrobium sp.]MCT4594837.1 Crp/Fnr family transcriptional regulator [Anaeromicrobium sp.]
MKINIIRIRDMSIEKLLNEDLEIFRIILNSEEIFKKSWEYIKYRPGEILCEYGYECKYFYVILSGFVNIYHTSEKGKTYSQSVYGKGYYIGELELFTNKPFICGVETMTGTEIIRISKDIFLKWTRSDMNILYYLMKTLCDSSYTLSEKASYDTLYSLKFRICDYLIDCKKNPDYYKHYKIFLSKKYLSERFVVTTRSINRILKELYDKSLIDFESNYIKIIDLKGLEEEREKERFM